MFVVEVVALLTTFLFLRDLAGGADHLGFSFQIILWLWFTLFFANFAEAMAEGQVRRRPTPFAPPAPPRPQSGCSRRMIANFKRGGGVARER